MNIKTLSTDQAQVEYPPKPLPPLSVNGVVNNDHPEAYKALQSAPVGRVIRICCQTKKGAWHTFMYMRQGYRPNISRKWLPTGFRE